MSDRQKILNKKSSPPTVKQRKKRREEHKENDGDSHQIVAHALLRAASRLISTPPARDKTRVRTYETLTDSPLNPDSPWKTTLATLGMLELPWRVPPEK